MSNTGRGLASPVISRNEDSELFWKKEVKKIVERMYPGAFTVVEKVRPISFYLSFRNLLIIRKTHFFNLLWCYF